MLWRSCACFRFVRRLSIGVLMSFLSIFVVVIVIRNVRRKITRRIGIRKVMM